MDCSFLQPWFLADACFFCRLSASCLRSTLHLLGSCASSSVVHVGSPAFIACALSPSEPRSSMSTALQQGAVGDQVLQAQYELSPLPPFCIGLAKGKLGSIMSLRLMA